MTAGVTLDGFAYGLMATAYDRGGNLPVVHPAISQRLSVADRALLSDSEELCLINGWIELNDSVYTLTDKGRAEVERRRQLQTQV